MTAIIQIKRSQTAAAQPASLAYGELGINITDKKIYIGNSSGATTLLVDGNAIGGSTSTETIQDAAASLFTSGTHVGISVSYPDTNNAINLRNTGVLSFNSRTGSVSLTSSDVTNALGFTPISGVSTETIQDAAASLFTTGTHTGISVSYPDTNNAINLTNTGVLSFNTRTGAVSLTSSDVTTALGFTPVNFLGYDYEIHVSQVDGNDSTGNGDLLSPVASVTKAMQIAVAAVGVSDRRTIIMHPGTYTENVTLSTGVYLFATGLLGANTVIAGTVTVTATSRISGIKMTNLVVNTTAPVYIANTTVDTQMTVTNTGYLEITGCSLQCTSGVTISGAAATGVIFNATSIWGLTVTNASALVIVRNSPQLLVATVTAGTLALSNSLVFPTTNTGNAITTSAGSVVTLSNLNILIPSGANVARVSLSGFYSIIDCVYDKPNSTLVALSGTGGSTNSIDYFQYINADKFITQGGTSSQFVKGDGSLDSIGVSTETIQDAAASLFTSGTHTGISVSYPDTNNSINLVNTGVLSFNSRTGAVTLTSLDVTTALGFTPTAYTAPTLGSTTLTSGTTITTVAGLSSVTSTSFVGALTGNASTVTNGVYTTDTGTVTNTMLAGSIANNKLANSSITVNGSSISLGGSATVTATATNALTIGTGLSGSSYNGSTGVTIAIDSTVATLTGNQTLTNKTLTSPTINSPTISNLYLSDGLILVEGTTNDSNEMSLVVGTLTADRTITLPDTSGTVITTGNLTSITSTGTISSGTWNATAIGETRGGTNQTTYATGDLLYASATNTLSKLTKPASLTSFLQMTSAGVPSWTSTIPTTNGGTGLTSFTSGGLVYASSTSALTTGTVFDIDSTNNAYRINIASGALPKATQEFKVSEAAFNSSAAIGVYTDVLDNPPGSLGQAYVNLASTTGTDSQIVLASGVGSVTFAGGTTPLTLTATPSLWGSTVGVLYCIDDAVDPYIIFGDDGTNNSTSIIITDTLSTMAVTATTLNLNATTVDCGFNTLLEPTLKYYNEVTASPTISSNTLTLNLSTAQVFTVSLNANITTLTISNTPATANRSIGFTLILTADGTARTVTWGSAIKWANNDPPTLTSTNGKKDILSFVSPDNGTNWYGFIGGLNY